MVLAFAGRINRFLCILVGSNHCRPKEDCRSNIRSSDTTLSAGFRFVASGFRQSCPDLSAAQFSITRLNGLHYGRGCASRHKRGSCDEKENTCLRKTHKSSNQKIDPSLWNKKRNHLHEKP
ncbi:MAG: hypothetical protein Q7T22_07450, partial [Serpentinimonas sp.]|nr:hypothetical protein [Serpentinimonas sp.]